MQTSILPKNHGKCFNFASLGLNFASAQIRNFRVTNFLFFYCSIGISRVFIFANSKITIKLKEFGDCSSDVVIYAARCETPDSIYVGHTGVGLRSRFDRHSYKNRPATPNWQNTSVERTIVKATWKCPSSKQESQRNSWKTDGSATYRHWKIWTLILISTPRICEG